MNVDKKNIKEYNAGRSIFGRKYLCKAPFVNMYFNIHGDAAPCWLTFSNPDHYPDKTIKDIWMGEKFNQIRHNITHFTLEKTCGVCLSNIQNKNYLSVLAKAYDAIGKSKKYPLMMELELDNTCNLECIMCDGYLSSSIRKSREKKLPLIPPYDNIFVEQLNEFIPHLREIRFNGGEPFLSNIFFKICDNIFRLNPDLNIVVATNGSHWNEKIEQLLEKGKFNINISIDSLDKQVYESIRINGDFDRMMANFYKFHRYCEKNKTKLCVLVNPMRQNWQEMGNFVNFCNQHNVLLWFNTIQHPEALSLWALSTSELTLIFNTLSPLTFSANLNKSTYSHNVKVFKNLVNTQIYNWLQESKSRKVEAEKNPINTFNDLSTQLVLLMKDKGYDEQRIKNELEIIHVKIDEILQFYKEKGTDSSALFKIIQSTSIDILYDEIISKSVEELTNQIKF